MIVCEVCEEPGGNRGVPDEGVNVPLQSKAMVVCPLEIEVPERGNLGYPLAGRSRKDARGDMSTELKVFASIFVILVLA